VYEWYCVVMGVCRGENVEGGLVVGCKALILMRIDLDGFEA